MTNRKTKILLSEFWSNYSILFSVILALSPFLLIFAARGMIFPLVVSVVLLIIFAIVNFVNALDQTEIIVKKENEEVLNALRGIR